MPLSSEQQHVLDQVMCALFPPPLSLLYRTQIAAPIATRKGMKEV